MSKILHLLGKRIHGQLQVPGDKSMSHRSVIFGSLAEGKTTIHNFLMGEDCLRTIHAFQEMGVDIHVTNEMITINGNGISELAEPKNPIDFGNSGTTARLLLGILAGQPFHTVMIGDESLSKRPMDRVTIPLKEMGVKTDGRENGKLLPMSIRGGELTPITYELPVNSAQVKSAILLAGLFTEGQTTVVEPVQTRDHTERMIKAFGGKIVKEGNHISIVGQQKLIGCDITIPGDISSAAFFIAAATIVPNSNLIIKNVGLNETRTGIIDVLQQMGANIELMNTSHIGEEIFGDIHITTSELKGIEIAGDIIPRIIDEIPLLALCATQAEGRTEIRDAEELRFKETDRIQAVVHVLKELGATITELDDGMIIHGRSALSGGTVPSFGDHRIGMMAAIASLLTKNQVEIDDTSCINISYPNFFKDLLLVTQDV
jgi:3-phosphoshikimate 1-carboxyvinyltransferase